MSYNAFLLVMSQWMSKKKAHLVIQGHVIFFESSLKKNHVKLSTQVFSGENHLPPGIRACVSSYGEFRWQKGGAYLKLDLKTHSILLIEEVEMEKGKYIPFKQRLSAFLSAAVEWKEILQEIAEKDYSFVRLF